MDPRDIQNKITQRPPSKRQLLKTAARFSDPLGLFSPVSKKSGVVSCIGKIFCPMALELVGTHGKLHYLF